MPNIQIQITKELNEKIEQLAKKFDLGKPDTVVKMLEDYKVK